MKALLYKQMKLCAHPMTFIFALFGCMLIIPNYPYTVAFFYVTLGIFFMYVNMREQRDSFFSALLPVKKSDTVKSGILFSSIIEIISIVLSVPFMFISQKINPKGGNLAGIDANFALIGMGFICFALFNVVFFPSFYKTGYKAGVAFIKSSAVMLFAVIFDIIAPHIPLLSFIDGKFDVRHIWILLIGIAVYIIFSVIAIKKSIILYNNVDL